MPSSVASSEPNLNSLSNGLDLDAFVSNKLNNNNSNNNGESIDVDGDDVDGDTFTAYARRFLANLNALRHQNGALCDVELVPGWISSEKTSTLDLSSNVAPFRAPPTPTCKTFLAHRMVLAAASPYFHAMFTSEMAEARRARVVLRSVGDRALGELLDFVYTGRVRVTRDNVQELMVAADMMELREAVAECTRYLLRELEPTNAVGILRFARDHNCSELAASVTSFVRDRFAEVAAGEEFRDAPRELVVDFLASEYLRVDSEYQVFRAALSWVEFDLSGRRRFIFDILKCIRLPLVPSKLVDAYLAECADMSLRVALTSVKRDLASRKGSLVSLSAEPRLRAKKNIYVIGGSQRELRSAWTKNECTYQTVEVFDSFKGTWHQAAPMRVGRILPGIAVVNGLIHVCGGEVDSQILASGEVYDPAEDAWRPLASMRVPRCEFGMCAIAGKLYAFGGWVGEDIGGSIERYDPAADRWTLIATMPEPRFSMGIFAHGGLVYLVGGCTHSRRHMQELVSYNPGSGEWKSYASMLEPRSQMGCAVLDDYLYVIGGTNRQNEVLQSVERYSFSMDRWETVSPMRQPRASPSVAAADGRLYVFGGDQIHEVNFYRARTTVAAAEVFDPLTGEWSDSTPLPQSRSEAGAVVV